MPKKSDKTPEQILIDELNKKIEELESEKKSLETEKKDQEEMVKRAQFDYINLKMDFDRFQKNTADEKKTQKATLLIESIKKFLPFVETMRKSLESIDEEQKESSLGEWVAVMYKNFLSTLAAMHIEPIEALGQEPDTLMHEPVGMQPTENEKLKGKIIQEFERGFVYKKDGETKVITTSKVVIGQ